MFSRQHHGAGIAARLMDWALDEARRRGAEELYLTVFVENHRARRFYERYDFVPVGRYDFMVGSQADEDVIMRKCAVSEVEVIRSASLGAVPHGFLGRKGGVSTGELAGLNVGYGSNDDREAIDENRRRAIAAVLPGAELATVHQVHSAEAVTVERPWPQDERPHADAMVTDRPGLLLGILTADCAPVLLADAEAGVIGAAHAGWRGALAGVTEATIAAMEALGARREHIAAAVGPCIAQPSYEVDEGFRTRFIETDIDKQPFLRRGSVGQAAFRPWRLCRSPAQSAGIAEVESLEPRHFCRGGAILQLSPRDASRRGGLWPTSQPYRPSPNFDLTLSRGGA